MPIANDPGRPAQHSLNDLLELGRMLHDEEAGGGARPLASHLAGRVLSVRNRSGRHQRLVPNAAQLLFERHRGQRNIVLKARQMGITTWIAGRFFLKTITQRGVLTVQVAHTREAAEAIFGMVQRMWENLPAEWREGSLARTRSTAGRMVFGALDSEFRVLSAGEENAGRGLTIQNLHLSEVSRWPGDAASTLAGLRAALAPNAELTLESTPSGAGGAFYDEWQMAQETGMVRHFFPWWLEPSYTSAPVTNFSEDERQLVEREGLSPAQVGYRRQLTRSFRNLRAQEFAEDPESCFRASGDCCFSLDAIEQRLRSLPEPIASRRNGALQVWLPALPRLEYILGVDSAQGGSDGDFASIQVIERWTGLQCAELRERLPPIELARVATQLAIEYNYAQIVVERNNHGAAVIAYLDATEHYDHLYEKSGLPGWPTTAASKPAMVSRIGAILEETPALFASRRLLQECRTFVTRANGATGATFGAHDDCLMAMAVAQSARAESLAKVRR